MGSIQSVQFKVFGLRQRDHLSMPKAQRLPLPALATGSQTLIGIKNPHILSIIRMTLMEIILFLRLDESQSRSVTDDELRRRRLERFS